MPRIIRPPYYHHAKGAGRKNHAAGDPYGESDEESILSSYSQSSSTIPSRSSMSLTTRRQMKRLMADRNALLIAEIQLEDERRRGRCMLFACIVLGCLCLILFKDRWPEDARGSLIHFLESKSDTNTNTKSPSNANDFMAKHSSSSSSSTTSKAEKKKTTALQQYSRDDPASGVSTYMGEYATTKKKSKPTSSNSDLISANIAQAASKPTSEEPSNEEKEQQQQQHAGGQHAGGTFYEKRGRPPPSQIGEVQHSPVTPSSTLTAEEKTANKEAALMEDLDHHLDNLSKYLKWNLPYKHDRDVPVQWSIPLTGTSLLTEIFGRCYGLVQAADRPALISGHEQDKILNVITEQDGSKYLNVNMGTLAGINRANQLRLASSNAADVIRTSYLYESALIFQGTAKYAKCFTIMRNPIDRSVDVFRKLKASSKNAVFQGMTLEEYAKSAFIEDNWMVRFLANQKDGKLESHHFELAQHILGSKCLVGLAEQFEESARRFAKYFDWESRASGEELNSCKEELGVLEHVEHEEYVLSDMGEKIPKNLYAKGTEIYELLAKKNALDMQLYHYARGLFNRQALYS